MCTVTTYIIVFRLRNVKKPQRKLSCVYHPVLEIPGSWLHFEWKIINEVSM